MKLSPSCFFASALIVVSLSTSNAAVFTGNFDFTGAAGNVGSLTYNGPTVSDVTVGNLVKVGVTTSTSSGNSRATGWPTGATTGSDTFTGTVDLGKYYEFSLTAGPGFTIDMTSITFGVGRSATGTRQSEWRSSVDAYASVISTYSAVNAGLTNTVGVLTNPDANSSWTGNVLDLSGTSYDGLSTITFRFYMFNSEASAGTAGLQGNLSFSGNTVATVPEPNVAALFGAVGVLGLLRRRRY